MQTLRLIALVSMWLGLSGCSFLFGDEGRFRERAMDYKKAESIPPVQVPEDMTSKELRQRYPIPPLGNGNFFIPKKADDLPKPQALLNVNEDAGVELRADGDRHWLVVNQPRERLWLQVKEFLTTNGLLLDREDEAQGTLETRWLKPRAKEDKGGFWAGVKNLFTWGEDDVRERFRLTFSAAPEQAATQIEIHHVQTRKREDALPQAADIDWPRQPQDSELVLVLYNELLDFLGEGGRQVSFSVLSQDLQALPRYVMTWDGNGYPVLVINQDFNRAWQDVGNALNKARVGMEDLDRSLGIYYLTQKALYEAEDEKPQERPLQLRVARSESGILVSVQFDDDTLAPKEESAAVLNRLREALE